MGSNDRCLLTVFILDSRFSQCFGQKLSCWLSACSVLIVVPLFKMRHSFPLVSWNGRC